MSFIGTQTTDVRSLRNIMTKDGKPCTATATENIWVGGAPFSEPSIGNEVTPFTTGKAYFSALIAALKAAQNTIYITGWQVNWDAQLDAQGTRLFDVLLEAAKNNKNLKIYVMPWDDTAPVQTYDDQTAAVLLLIKKLVDRECVFVTLAQALADENASFFTHHQKQVVIDGKIGFVGGIDLAYGRYDDATYDLHADAEGRAALNRYNGCVLPIGVIPPDTVVDTDLLTGAIDRLTSRGDIITAIEKGAHQAPYAEDSPTDPRPPGVVYTTLDPKSQPRLPWQDVHVQIAGPAVADLALNFVLRWNSIVGNSRLPLPPPATSHPAGSGSCTVQVLRSAPRRMCVAEYSQVFGKDNKSRLPMPDKAQSHIAAAMEILIDKAHHFIYIENQFFVSGFGKVDGLASLEFVGPAKQVQDAAKHGVTVTRTMAMWDVDKPPQNKICALLIKRINAQIIASPNQPFHVYITLPVHSEGMLNSGAIMTQIHWTMQSLVFGTNSLLNGIRRSLKARALLDKKDKDWKRVYADGNIEHQDIPVKECFKYVTLLNLRNWAKIGDKYVTEQIYVHSKLMIIDDRFALLGSANINDRSLLGSRDSELAVLIMDTDVDKADLCGDGKQRPTRGFARKLRQEVWNKLFGITAGGDRATTELKQAVDSPGDPKSWEAIQKVAAANTVLYEAAFDFIPRNKDAKDETDPYEKRIPASIWPRWHAPTEKNASWTKSGPMPFESKFWSTPQFNASAAAKLTGVKGFITLLPIEWTMGENNNIGYATILVTVNDKKTTTPFPQANTYTVLNEPSPDTPEGKA